MRRGRRTSGTRRRRSSCLGIRGGRCCRRWRRSGGGKAAGARRAPVQDVVLSEIATCASCAAMTYQMKIQPCAFWMEAIVDHLEAHRFLL